MPSQWTLCSSCTTALSHEVESSIATYPLDRIHHSTLSSFRLAIASGCYICALIAEELRPSYGDVAAQTSNADYGTHFGLGAGERWKGQSVLSSYCLDRGEGHWTTGPRAFHIGISISEDALEALLSPAQKKSMERNFVVGVAVEPMQELASADRAVTGHVASDRIGDEETWTLLERWHARCKEQHVECQVSGGKFTPTRLVFCGDAHTTGSVRVVETKDANIKGEYVTLSHRWGSNQTIQLFKENIASFKKGIPLADLPPKYQDAVTVAQRLRAQYIWIDSLCIVQNSAPDWQRESGVMDQIYAHSALNIAVTGAADGAEGCFRTRSPVAASSCVANVNGQAYSISLSENLTTRLSAQPLNSRAWVVQERLLAPRTLHFARDQLYWECRTLRCSESAPSRHPSDDLFASFRCAIAAPHVGDDAVPALLKSWDRIVHLYTGCGLTKSGDKLVALAGLAKAAQRHLGTYHAGMWEVGLLTALLWHKPYRSPELKRYEGAYLAPSWSWASVEGAVRMVHAREREMDHELKVHQLAHIVEVKTEPVGGAGNSTGALKSGVLKIRGEPTEAWYTDDAWRRKQKPTPEGSKAAWIDLGEPVHGTPGLDFDVHNDVPGVVGKQYFCLPIIATGPGGRRRGNTQGLILKRASKNPFSKTYVRVGAFEELADDFETRFWYPERQEILRII